MIGNLLIPLPSFPALPISLSHRIPFLPLPHRKLISLRLIMQRLCVEKQLDKKLLLDFRGLDALIGKMLSRMRDEVLNWIFLNVTARHGPKQRNLVKELSEPLKKTIPHLNTFAIGTVHQIPGKLK